MKNITDTFNSLLDISEIDVRDSKSVHRCIEELNSFDLYLYKMFNELPNWWGCDRITYNSYVSQVHSIFSECIRDIKKYEGIDFYKTHCLLVTCERLTIFFMEYIKEYNNTIGVYSE